MVCISQGVMLIPFEGDEGMVAMRSPDGYRWLIVPDYRGRMMYATDNSGPVMVKLPGEIPHGFTLTVPATRYDTWNGEKWVTDTEAQHAAEVSAAECQKKMLLSEAQATISLWQTELQLGIISDEDKASLITWMNYIKAVKMVDMSKAANITWPVKPAI